MDYTQTSQAMGAGNDQPFFTAGAGTESVEENSFEPENNLDLTNQSWGQASERNRRDIGSNVLRSSEPAPEFMSKEAEELKKLGQIVELEMPPGVELSSTPVESQPAIEHKVSKKDLLVGDRLSSHGLNLIKSEEQKLSQDGDIASFYDFIAKTRKKILSEDEIESGAK